MNYYPIPIMVVILTRIELLKYVVELSLGSILGLFAFVCLFFMMPELRRKYEFSLIRVYVIGALSTLLFLTTRDLLIPHRDVELFNSVIADNIAGVASGMIMFSMFALSLASQEKASHIGGVFKRLLRWRLKAAADRSNDNGLAA